MNVSVIRTLGVVFIGLLIVVAPVSAQQDQPASNQNSRTETPVPDQATRIEGYKKRVNERVTAVKKERIAGRCKAAQVRIATLQQSASARNEARNGVYRKVTTGLDTMITRLQNAGADTTELQTLVVELQTKANEMMLSMQEQMTLLTDLAQQKCEEDPEAFQAILKLTREARSELRTQAQEMKKLLQNDTKQLLEQIRAELVNNATQSEEQ